MPVDRAKAGATKRCLVAVDTPRGPELYALELDADATVEVALAAARGAAAGAGADQGIDWEGAEAGIWGERCRRDAVPRDGDRVELYRPLTADPRERRRQRARSARRC